MIVVAKVVGVYLAGCLVLGTVAVLPAPRWLERRYVRSNLRALADERRRIRREVEVAELRFRRGDPGAGADLARLTLTLCDIDHCVDVLLDDLDAVST